MQPALSTGIKFEEITLPQKMEQKDSVLQMSLKAESDAVREREIK